MEEAVAEVAVGAAEEDEGSQKLPSTRRSDQAERRRGAMIAEVTKSTLWAALALVLSIVVVFMYCILTGVRHPLPKSAT